LSSGVNLKQSSLLKLESISKSFSAESGLKVNVLENINFEIPALEKGIIVSILAPFTSGKSTLLKIISGLVKPSEGRIILGNSLSNKNIPYIPEKPSSFPWLNVSQNIEFALDISNNKELKLNRLIELAGLQGYENHFPDNRSTGFRFRISLARALASGSSLVLIDDSFKPMKKESREEIYDLLPELSSNHRQNFILATTNLIEAILLSDKIFLMSKKPGKIIKMIDIERSDRQKLKDHKSEKFTTIKTEIETAFEESESLSTINYSV
jgi:NitT/TauT family transport system ATP-binding protein